MCSSQSSSGSSARRAGATLRSEPSTARRNSAVLASRAGADSGEKGESGRARVGGVAEELAAEVVERLGDVDERLHHPAQPVGEAGWSYADSAAAVCSTWIWS